MTTEDRKAQLGVSVDTTESEQGFARIAASGRAMADKVAQAGHHAAEGIDAIGQSADAPATKIDKATSSIIASVQRATAAAQAAGKSTSAYYESLANQRGANIDVLRPYLDQLDQVTAKQAAAAIATVQGTSALNGMGMSAKATAAAMRGVPAQFTDIIVSLQGGQKPMTVLLQQGGQLKDMFGGIGNATQALGTYIIGLANPLTLIAAAVGVLGYAYFKGTQDIDVYTKALILSGNAAGTTAGQLGAMAASISKISGTQSGAAAALADMAKSGAVGRDNLEAFTLAAIRFQSATGAAVGDTVKQFQELAKSPLEATLKLNTQYNYLTESVYRQIKALEDQGKTTAAADLAQKSLADTLDVKTVQMLQNLGLLEKGWLSVKQAIYGAWDATKNGALSVGRPDTVESQIAALEKQIAGAGALGELARSRGQSIGIGTSPELLSLQAQLSTLKGIAYQQGELAKQDAERQTRVGAIAKFDQDGLKYLTDAQKIQRDINAVQELGRLGEIDSLKVQQRIKEIRESYAKKSSGRSGDPFAADRDFAKEYAKTWEDFVKIGDEAAGKTNNLSKAEERLLVYLQSPAYANHAASMREMVLQQSYVAIGLERDNAARKKEVALLKESADAAFANSEAIYASRLATEEKLKAQRLENETIGMTAVQIANLARARDLEAAAGIEAKIAVYASAKDRQEDIDNLRATATALRDVAAARVDAAVRKQDVADWQSFFSSIDQTAHTTWTNVLQGNQDIWPKMRASGKAVLFDWLYQMTAKKWIINVGANFVGNSAMAQAGSAMGGLGGLANLVGLNSVSGLGSVFGSEMAYAASIGSTSIGAGSQAAMLAAQTGEFGAAGLSATAGAAGTGAGLMSSVGAAVPYVAAAVAAYYAINALSPNTKPSIEGGYASAGTQGSANGKAYVNGLYGGTIDAAAKGISENIAATYAATVASLGGRAGNLTTQSFIGLDQGGKGSQNALSIDAQLNGKWLYNRYTDQGGSLAAGTTDAQMTAATELSGKKILLEALKASSLAPALTEYLAAVTTQGKTLEEVNASLADVTTIGAFNHAIRALPFDYLSEVAASAVLSVTKAAGGIDNLQNSFSSYVEAFYSDAEKASASAKGLSADFAAIGIDMPAISEASRNWYRTLVDAAGAQDLSSEANAQAYTKLLALASSVDAVAKSAEDSARANRDWQTKLDVLTGLKTARQVQLESDLASTSNAATKAIILQIYAQEESTAAVVEAQKSQDAYSASLKSAQSAFDTARAAVTAAFNGIKAVQAQATDGYLTAQERVTAAQTQIADIQKRSLADLANQANATADRIGALGKTLRQTLADAIIGTSSSPASSTLQAQSAFFADLVKTRAGDEAALSAIGTSGKALLDAAKGSATSSNAYEALRTQVLQGIAEAAAIAEQKAAQRASVTPAETELAKAQSDLASAQTSLVEALRIANTINAPLVKTQADLIAQFADAQAEYAAAIVQQSTAQTTLADIAKNTAQTTLAVQSVLASLENTIARKFDTLDLSGNGGLSYDELRQGLGIGEDLTRLLISRLDTNSDGQLSRLELIASNTYGLDKAARINLAAGSFVWNEANRANSVAGFTAVAKQSNWTLEDIANATGYSIDSLSTLFAGTGLARSLAASTATPTATGQTGGTTGVVAGPGAVVNMHDYIRSLAWGSEAVDSQSTASLYAMAMAQHWTQALIGADLGFTEENMRLHFAKYGFPAFAVGTNYVPKDMLAKIHEGEAILPKAYNPWAGGKGGGAITGLSTAVLQSLLDEMRAFRSDARSQASAIVGVQSRMTKLVERWDGSGMPETRITA